MIILLHVLSVQRLVLGFLCLRGGEREIMEDPRLNAIETQIKKLQCDHPRTIIRYRLSSSNVKMFKEQCTRCGELIGSWIPHKQIECPEKIKPIDDDLTKRYRDNCHDLEHELLKRKRELEKKDFRGWYNEYLRTPEWYEKRAAVLERCCGICEGCRMATASEVHHLTYQNVGNEFIFELVGLCHNCHERYHEKNGVPN